MTQPDVARSLLGHREPECPIAIVGIGCRFPGAVVDPESFWKLLVEGRSGVREVPSDRWSIDRYYHPDPAAAGTMITKWGGFVDNLDAFDARFWSISPREAMRMDPQQRWLLEVAWEAIEDAGVAPRQLRGHRIGVFVGIAGNDYGGLQLPNLEGVDAYTNSGSTLSIASNRISYMFDFNGPSISVDTACSSSAVAVAMACQNIWLGSCVEALVGGVNALITPHATVGFSKAAMVSPSGQCFAFDARANGYVRGEGAGVVYLKPLAAALADGNRIYAVIRSAVVNQDGHTSSMTVPSVDKQAEMLRDAYRQAGISPASVAYVEAHGTGTPVGDPIEATALGRVLGQGRPDDRPCLIGSVKTNIGHLEAGSGIAGLIKAALVAQRRTIPPNLNYQEPSPHIPFAELRLQVVDRLQPLPQHGEEPPVVAVNSFGFGGTNAHVVLQAAPAPTPRVHSEPAERPCVLPISARDETALGEYVEAYRSFLENSAHSVLDVCAAAGTRKEHHTRRLVVTGTNAREIRKRLANWRRDGHATGVVAGQPSAHTPPVFVFTGQGTQWWGMGRQLLEREPVFRGAIDEIDARFRSLAGWSLVAELRRPEGESRIDHTDVAQPAIFAVQVGLAALWKTWGVQPAAVVGHSVGEVAAAYVAGALSLDDAVTVIFHRSRLQHTTSGSGRMVAVALSPDAARAAIGADTDRVEIAGINSPNLVTLAGDAAALERITTRLDGAGVFTRWLRIQYAFHSRHMDPIEKELVHALAEIRPRASRIPFVSTVTGAPVATEALDAQYWWHNVRRPVLFGPAIATLIGDKHDTFVELGPHPALESALKECLAEHGGTGAVFHSLRRDADDSSEMLSAIAGMQVFGVPIDWRAVNQSDAPVLPLPRYPWTRESFWLESTASARLRLQAPAHPLLGVQIAAAVPTWEFTLDLARLSYFKDHRIWDSVVFPAAGYVEMGLALARQVFPNDRYAVADLQIDKALFVDAARPPAVQIVYNAEDKTFSVYTSTGATDAWERHAHGTLTPLIPRDQARVHLAGIRARLGNHFDHAQYCHEFAIRGYQFGEAFQQICNLWRAPGEALAEIEAPLLVADAVPDYIFHPALLDACFQACIGIKVAAARPEDDLVLPRSLRRIVLYGERPPARLWAHARLMDEDATALEANIRVYDDEGGPVADIVGFRMEQVDQDGRAADVGDWAYRFEWQPRPLRGSAVAGACALGTSADIIAAVDAAAPEVAHRHALAQYHRDYVPRARTAVCELIQHAFAELGWSPQGGDTIELASFVDALGIAEPHHRVTRNLLRDLEALGWLRAAGADAWTVLRTPGPYDVDTTLRALAADHPRFAAEVDVMRRMGMHLAAVLEGDADPTALLFPGGSQDMLERYYSEGLAFPAHLELVRVAVAKAVETLPRRRALRVLEVGGGTGSLTRVLLPALPAGRTEYLFTDVSPAFLVSARKRFADFSFVEYQTFDIEQPPEGQGIQPGSVDLIVAADVVHATADLGRTLSHLRACLADGGLLLFLELVTRDFVRDDIVFALLKGWWRFTDTAVRPHSALLDRGQWEALLARRGFHDVASFAYTQDGVEAEHAAIMGFAPPSATPIALPAPAVVPRRYLVFADGHGVADALLDRLRLLGHDAVLVRPGEKFRQDDATRFSVAPKSEDDLRRLLATETVGGGEIAGVVHCWSLDHPRPRGMHTDRLREAQDTGVLSAFHLVRVLADRPLPVWFVTRNACRVTQHDGIGGLASAPLVGLTRVANNEQQCAFSVVDLDACAPSEAAEHLAAEITAARDGEFETAYRDGIRHALRLRRVRAEEMPKRTFDAVLAAGSVTPYRLETRTAGVLTNLALHETSRPSPGPKDIEVRVRAGGLNFRDVMKALGTHPGTPRDLLWFGDDFSGVVERVGGDVCDFRPGDAVAGIAPFAFRTYVTTDARLAFRLPPGMAFVQAATLPTVFLTAHYALHHLARMQRGERILIHAAAGGVGQAALQIAQSLGLEIFATAGTPEKRRLLSEMGVPHVMSSRNLEFADEIMDITRGRGVDAVLNSLAGDFIVRSLSVLAPFGRFLEIGKVDIYRNAKIGLQPLRNNVSYFVIDVTQHVVERPALLARLFAEIEERFASGEYQPLPSTSFPITAAADAFRFMAQARHVGKVVLDFDVDRVPIAFGTDPLQRFRPDASYLITGGTSGFGLEVAKWMAGHGARHLVLMSRTGPRDDAARRDLDELRAAGVTVIDARGDVTREDDVRRVVKENGAGWRPLRGVVHAAMVLDDDSLTALDEARFARVLEPKMAGAWNLHLATRDASLEHFVCFSSFSAVLGGPRQSAYNAGNAFLGALAHFRRAEGLPALTVDWGAIRGAGFVERNQKTGQYLDKIGFGAFPMDEALRIFDRLVSSDVAHIVAARVSWRSLSQLSALVDSSATYAAVARERDTGGGGGSVSARLHAAGGVEERAALVEDFIASQVTAVFGMAEVKLDRTAPLTSLGLDSLMTVELINRMDTHLGLRIPMGKLLSGPSIKELAQIVLKLIPTADSVEPAVSSVEATASEHVVALRATGDQPPLIAFHPVGGGVGIYAPLARALPGNVPVYGIESKLVRGVERDFADVDAMVSAYVAAVRECAPPPYRLFGFSFGGYLAARVAEALERQGDDVDFVGVVEWDARPRTTLQAQRDALFRLSVATYEFVSDMGAVRPLPDSQLHAEMGRLVDRVIGERPGRADLYFQWAVDNGLFVSDGMQGWGRAYLAGFGQHLAMIAGDLPLPRFQARLALWRTTNGFGSPLESWAHDGARAIEHVIDGDHFEPLRPAGVITLARQMDDVLRPHPVCAAARAGQGK
jgi:acyl transferase domain-containing protein/NADPH:quinone reductase-like Zn-dependent oxidoreductase/thioesterase domain-containing protein/NAD(P)-dependent dehydrogenase (short-subunit alcohol dehydrogenase family)/SAM-dependent methyltransferase/acyl carrier protein